jgi:hypothetical protein
MELAKCRTCGERHSVGPCPQSLSLRSRSQQGQGASRKPEDSHRGHPHHAGGGTSSGGDGGVGDKSVEPRELAPSGARQVGSAKATQPTPPDLPRGRPRIGEERASRKPWAERGMSRATWYRRRAEEWAAKKADRT